MNRQIVSPNKVGSELKIESATKLIPTNTTLGSQDSSYIFLKKDITNNISNRNISIADGISTIHIVKKVNEC